MKKYLSYCMVVLTTIAQLSFLLIQGVQASAQNNVTTINQLTDLNDLNFCSNTILTQQILNLSKTSNPLQDKLFTEFELRAHRFQVTNKNATRIITMDGEGVLSTDFLQLFSSDLSISTAGTLNSSDFKLVLLNGAYQFTAQNISQNNESLHVDNVSVSFCEGKALLSWGLQAESLDITPKFFTIHDPKIKIFGLTVPGPPKLSIVRDGLYANGLLFPQFASIEKANYIVLPAYFRLRKNIGLTTAPWFALDTNSQSIGLYSNLDWLGYNHGGHFASWRGKNQLNRDIRLDLIQVKGNFKQNFYIDTLFKHTNSLEFFNQFNSLLFTDALNPLWTINNNYLSSKYLHRSKNSRFKMTAKYAKPFYQLTAFNPTDAHTEYKIQHSYNSPADHNNLNYYLDNRITHRSNKISRLQPLEILGAESRQQFSSHAGIRLNLHPVQLQGSLGIKTLNWQPDTNLATLTNATSGSLVTQYAVIDASTSFFINQIFVAVKGQHRSIKSDIEVGELTFISGESGLPNAIIYPFLNAVLPEVTPHSVFRLADFAGSDELMIGDRTSIGIEATHDFTKAKVQFSFAHASFSNFDDTDQIGLRQMLGIEDISKLTAFQFDYISRKQSYITVIHTDGWHQKSSILRLSKTSKYYEYYLSKVKADQTRQLNRPADYETLGLTFKPSPSTKLILHHEFSKVLDTVISSKIILEYYGCCVIFSLGYEKSHYANLVGWEQYLIDPTSVNAAATLTATSGFKTDFNLKIPLTEYF